MIVKDFGQLIYRQLILIYGEGMEYNPENISKYQSMIKNYLKQKKSGSKVHLSRSNKE